MKKSESANRTKNINRTKNANQTEKIKRKKQNGKNKTEKTKRKYEQAPIFSIQKKFKRCIRQNPPRQTVKASGSF